MVPANEQDPTSCGSAADRSVYQGSVHQGGGYHGREPRSFAALAALVLLSGCSDPTDPGASPAGAAGGEAVAAGGQSAGGQSAGGQSAGGQSAGGAPGSGSGATPGGSGGADSAAGSGGSATPIGGGQGGQGDETTCESAPNELDPGDGTDATPATIVYNGKAATEEAAGAYSCRDAKGENQFSFQLNNTGGDFGDKSVSVFISIPRDLFYELQCRQFDIMVPPPENDYEGLDQAAVLVLGSGVDLARGIGGKVWLDFVDGQPLVRLQDVPLGDYESLAPTGDTVSLAFLCTEDYL